MPDFYFDLVSNLISYASMMKVDLALKFSQVITLLIIPTYSSMIL